MWSGGAALFCACLGVQPRTGQRAITGRFLIWLSQPGFGDGFEHRNSSKNYCKTNEKTHTNTNKKRHGFTGYTAEVWAAVGTGTTHRGVVLGKVGLCCWCFARRVPRDSKREREKQGDVCVLLLLLSLLSTRYCQVLSSNRRSV